MHTIMRFTLVCVCAAFLIAGVRESKCEDVAGAAGGAGEEAPDTEDKQTPEFEPEKKDMKTPLLSGGGRRSGSTMQSSGNGTRDSQLLSLLAARRRQLLNERLTAHLNTIAALSQKPYGYRNNTAFAQLELRDSNSSIIKRIIVADNASAKGSKPLIRIESPLATKDVTRLDLRPQETRLPASLKTFQDAKSRAGFLNNRRRELNEAKSNVTANDTINEGTISDETIGGAILYVPDLDEKLEGLEQEVVVDPEEEFQVDESNHGVYLLNYSDTSNITEKSNNDTISENNTKENGNITVNTSTNIILNMNLTVNQENVTHSAFENANQTETKNITDIITNRSTNIENSKENENNTLFMSDEIYNHFRPLETDLQAEDMAPFLFFGQKLSSPQFVGDNLTSIPSLSATTKSVNYILLPSDKKKYTSRYSATEKTKNTNVNEEELNEEMDVSVVKNVIEKNKVRNTVKGPAPARHISLLNAYRKPLPTVTTTTDLSVSEANANLTDDLKFGNLTRDGLIKSNLTNFRNHSRGYFNMRRRPVRLTTVENNPDLLLNATTEKSSTLVYTAVVTSVSITSSMKGQNKTDPNSKETFIDSSINNTMPALEVNITSINNPIVNETGSTSTTLNPSTTIRSRRVRIRSTTETITTNEAIPSPTPFVLVNKRKPNTNLQMARENISTFRTSPPRRLADSSDFSGTRLSLDNILTIDQRSFLESESEVPTTTSPLSTSAFRNRRRSTTTSTSPPTSYKTTTPTPTIYNTAASAQFSEPNLEETVSTLTPLIYATKSSPDSGSKTTFYYSEENTIQTDIASNEINGTEKAVNSTFFQINVNKNNVSSVRNEEVVIEAEKSYTASYVLAGLGFLPVTAIVVFVLRNVLLKKTKELDTEYEGYFEDGDIKKESPITPVTRLPMPPPAKPDQKWEFPRNKLRLQTLLGQGNFGQVWKAEADDLTGHDGLTRLVAVKTIKETSTQKEKQELLHEICIMQKIGTHPNVVTLLACCTEQEPYLLIMEYVMCGKLLTYLRERRSRPDRFGGGSGALTSRDLTVFAYCVARGMEYLASKGIVHRDLAARNVLVDHNKLCKIADFGMSREMLSISASEDRYGRPQRHALPVRWMAPEALLYNVFNHETDVWAYGILLWEIVTLGSTPYASMSGREVLQVVTEGYRLERPAHCKQALYRAMHACWNAAPAQRPPFSEIKGQLAQLLENEPSEGNYVDLDSFYQDSSVYSDPSAIIQDDGGISVEYSSEMKPEIRDDPPRPNFDKSTGNLQRNISRNFGFRDESFSFAIGSPRMGGFGIRDGGFRDQNFNERKDLKLSGSSFQRERETRENPLVARNSFSGGFQRLGSRDSHGFQLMSDGSRNKRVPEFECDI